MNREAAIALAFLKRECLLVMRRRNDLMEPLVFFILGLFLLRMASAQFPDAFATLLPGFLWVLGFLAASHSFSIGWRDERLQGELAELIRTHAPLALLALVRACVGWLATGLPLTLIAFVAAIAFGLPQHQAMQLALALLMGLALVCLIGNLIASLAIGAGRSSLLIALLLLPLASPILIFGIGASSLSLMDARAAFLWLGALTAIALPLAPLATAFMLKSVEDV